MEMYILGAVVVVFIGTGITLYNGLIGARNNVDESFSGIETVLQNRYDLIPNLIETVKQYATHEKTIFEQVATIRSSLVKGQSKDASKGRFEKENELQSALKSIFAVAENYPDLKASTNFIDLQNKWTDIEDRLQGARRAYNSAVKILRNKKQMFPSNIVAGMMNLPTYDMFESSNEAKTTKIDAKAMFNA